MTHVLALKLAYMLCAFLWAFVSLDLGWGPVATLGFCVAALSLGASAAKTLGQMGAREWYED